MHWMYYVLIALAYTASAIAAYAVMLRVGDFDREEAFALSWFWPAVLTFSFGGVLVLAVFALFDYIAGKKE